MDSHVSEWLTIADNGELPYFLIMAGGGLRRLRRKDLEHIMEPIGAAKGLYDNHPK